MEKAEKENEERIAKLIKEAGAGKQINPQKFSALSDAKLDELTC